MGDHPIFHNQCAVGQEKRFLDIVRDQQNRRFVALPELLDQALSPDPGESVESAERFVQQHQFGVAHQRPSQRRPLCLAAGQRLGPGIGAVGQAHFGQRRDRASLVRPPGQAKDDVAPDTFPWQQARCLERHGSPGRHPDVPADLGVEIGEDA